MKFRFINYDNNFVNLFFMLFLTIAHWYYVIAIVIEGFFLGKTNALYEKHAGDHAGLFLGFHVPFLMTHAVITQFFVFLWKIIGYFTTLIIGWVWMAKIYMPNLQPSDYSLAWAAEEKWVNVPYKQGQQTMKEATTNGVVGSAMAAFDPRITSP